MMNAPLYDLRHLPAATPAQETRAETEIPFLVCPQYETEAAPIDGDVYWMIDTL